MRKLKRLKKLPEGYSPVKKKTEEVKSVEVAVTPGPSVINLPGFEKIATAIEGMKPPTVVIEKAEITPKRKFQVHTIERGGDSLIKSFVIEEI